MNYQNVYVQIIENRKLNPVDGYTENHHIVPRSLGGNDDKSNLVKLTAREHFICHYLLTKIYLPKTKEFYSMIKAFMIMCHYQSDNQQRYVNSHLYHKLKKQFSEAQSYCQSGNKNSQFGVRRRCVHNKELKLNKRIQNVAELEDGWEFGRFNFERIEREKIDKELKEKIKQEQYDKNKEYYSNLYEIYNVDGWNTMVEKTGYNKTKENFVQRCRYFLDNFIPQNGKKRGAKFS